MRIRYRNLALALIAVALMGGCRFDTVLDAKGGGTLKATYRLGKDGTVAKLKRSFLSPNIKIVNATVDKQMYANVEIAFDDVTKLPTARLFSKLTVTRKVEDGVVALDGKLVNRQPTKPSPEALEYFGNEVTFTLTAPGDIVSSNATSTDGKTATWKWSAADLFAMPELVLNVSYKQPAS